jgi:hypothetical protein
MISSAAQRERERERERGGGMEADLLPCRGGRRSWREGRWRESRWRERERERGGEAEG